jgi:hypothetical protein
MVKVALWSLLIAAALGVAYYWVAANVWGILAAGNPINEALLDALVRRGHTVAYRVIISMHDLIVNVLLALPFAAAFCLFRALRSWTHVALAATAALIAGYGPTEWDSLPLLVRYWGFWLGFLMAGLSLPLAFAMLSRLRLGATQISAANDGA